MTTIHPIQLTWNMSLTKPGQLLPVIGSSLPGVPLELDWDADELDPNGHHNNAGGQSVVNGPLNPPTGSGDDYNPQGFFVWGGAELWTVDLWNDGEGAATEVQFWISLHKVVNGSALPDPYWTTLAREAHAPLQHDGNAWLPSGLPRQAYDDPNDPEGHDESVFHHGYTISPFRCPGDARARVTACQMHRSATVQDKPWPGYVRKARLGLCAMVL